MSRTSQVSLSASPLSSARQPLSMPLSHHSRSSLRGTDRSPHAPPRTLAPARQPRAFHTQRRLQVSHHAALNYPDALLGVHGSQMRAPRRSVAPPNKYDTDTNSLRTSSRTSRFSSTLLLSPHARVSRDVRSDATIAERDAPPPPSASISSFSAIHTHSLPRCLNSIIEYRFLVSIASSSSLSSRKSNAGCRIASHLDERLLSSVRPHGPL